MQLPQFKIRASAAASIVGGTVGLGVTDQKHLALCDKKRLEGKALTPNQAEKEAEIKKKLENPNDLLPSGLKTYCESWLKEKLYMRRKEFSSKYTDKGNLVEDDAIEYIKDYFELGFAKKNEKWYSNDYMHGTPDLVLAKKDIDAKSSFDFSTFPLFKEDLDAVYYWQGIVYMELTGRKHYEVIFCLMDMPETMLEKETTRALYQFGNEEKTYDELYAEMQAKYCYSGLPDQLRIKVFPFEYDQNAVNHLIKRVKLCRKYINDVLLPQIDEGTIEEILSYQKAKAA